MAVGRRGLLYPAEMRTSLTAQPHSGCLAGSLLQNSPTSNHLLTVMMSTSRQPLPSLAAIILLSQGFIHWEGKLPPQFSNFSSNSLSPPSQYIIKPHLYFIWSCPNFVVRTKLPPTRLWKYNLLQLYDYIHLSHFLSCFICAFMFYPYLVSI